ncbi:MAG: tetratricopeptide repeat protein [Candidatus Aminicenantes bacterium]|nr:tetratricopeptide repeat protein [Candidatus Aminicenantes bacterium]
MASDNRLKILQLAEKLFKQGKIDAAIKEYQKIIDLKPDDLEVRRIIGDLYLKLNKLPDAIKQFEWISDYYLKEGFFTKAIAMYRRITRIDPQNEAISSKLADLYTKQGLVIEAKQIYMEMAEEYKRQNNQKKALGIYRKILEFDRSNTKMRILLADNYLREDMKDEAINEYLTASDILIKKREFAQAEELLLQTYNKVKHLKIFEKLISCFISQGNANKAIQMLKNLGEDIFKHLSLLKILGELYFKNNLIEEAEHIYKKIAEIDPNETEVIMKLGKVYLQREEIEKAYKLFLPTIDRFIEKGKYDEANSLLRFIITSNNTYLPALNKLASIFKATKKTTSLIAMYESLLPIYEQKKMHSELIAVLKELIELSDSPFAYQEQLARLTGESSAEDEEGDQEREFISFQLSNADQALKKSDFKKAIDLLKTAQNAFPQNTDIRVKLFDVYQMSNDIEALLNEGIELLQIYKKENNDEAYKALSEKLTKLKPSDERLLDLGGHERTNIEIDFDHAEMIEQINELKHPGGLEELESIELKGEEEDIFLLKGEDSVQIKTDSELKKGLSSHLAELDFYISEGYFANAEKILDRLQKEFPESKEIASRLARIKKSKEMLPDKTDSIILKVGKTEPIEITSSIAQESDILQKFEDSKIGIDLDNILVKPEIKGSAADFAEMENVPFEIEMEKMIIHEPEPAPLRAKPEAPPKPSSREKSGAANKDFLGSSADFIDIDNIFTSDEAPASGSESPFKDIDENELAESEVDIFKSESVFLEEEEYYETEKVVDGEAGAIKYWIDELQKQRTSTVEKNMMEIFQAFQKGVDEKIGQEDYDTRYNLGIAYKEMGLIEEAIHEFLIASKHPLKYFDAAGLLGICFRDQGMFEESINWFEKALEIQDRKEDDYKAVKYELILTAKLKEDYLYAKKLAAEILGKDPNYRNIKEIYDEVKGK